MTMVTDNPPFSLIRNKQKDLSFNDLQVFVPPTEGTLRPSTHYEIKKIPSGLQRRKIDFNKEPKWYKRFFLKLKEDSQFFRSTIQIVFILLCLWIGIEFHIFVRWGISGGKDHFYSRPPGVEGFLPISALISVKYWLQTGVINQIHPSGFFIFIAIVLIGLLLKKAFCSWLCPIGTLCESLSLLGRKIFGRNLKSPTWLDYILRSLKYILLLFFVFSISQMDVPMLKAFIYSPYNKVADVKMYLFFANVTPLVLWTIIVLIVLSVLITNFWCRYLCPYGALLGIFSWLSPLKIYRNKTTCIDCELCTKACPSNIQVHKLHRVWSDECTSCLECVEVCPVKNTLDLRTHITDTRVPNWILGVLVVGVFVATTGLGILTGHWQNKIQNEEYLKHFQQIESPLYQHNRGKVPEYNQPTK